MAIMTFMEAVNKAIVEEMRRDPTIFTYCWGGPYYGAYGIAANEAERKAQFQEFGEARSDFTGIEENGEAGAGIGAALMGMRPIVVLGMSDWALDAGWQVLVNAPKMRFKLGYALDCPVIYKFYDGGTNAPHHSSRIHHWFANAPNMFVAIPSMGADAVGLWRTALRKAKDPVCMIESTSGTGVANIKGPVPEGDYMIPFGKGDVKREGKDVTIAAVGFNVHLALQAADDLIKAGINAEVWDPRTLMPFDRQSLIASVKKTGAMVVVDDTPKTFGGTGEFAMTIAEAVTPVPPMARVAMMDAPVAPKSVLTDYIVPSKEKIVSAVKSVLARKKG